MLNCQELLNIVLPIETNKISIRVIAVAQLTEELLLTAGNPGLNLAINNFY